MSDLHKNVGGREQYPEGWIGVNPIEKDKKGKEEFPKDIKKGEKSLLFGAFIVFVKKCVHFFSKEKTQVDQQQLIEDLLSFRKMLQILANEDQSHNPEFTQQLSELWHNLTDTVQGMRGEELHH